MADFDFRKKLKDFHPKNIRKDVAVLEGEISLPNCVALVKTDNVVINNALKDMRKFLKSAFDIMGEIDDSAHGFKLVTEISSVLSKDKKTYTISVTDDEIKVVGESDRTVAQGIYYLEFLMFEKKSPILKKGDITVNLPYSPRMVHSAYGYDDFPDEYLQNIARYGYDAILLFTKGVNLSPAGELSFKDHVERASKFGLDVYVYAAFGNFIDIYADNAEEEFDKTYGAVFKECPGLKGITLVGESVEFKSRDPRVAPHSIKQKPADNLGTGVPTPGWFPCNDYPKWIDMVKNSIRKYNPNADVVFWSYNWGWAPEKERVELINNLPKDISLNVTFEMFEHYDMMGSDQMVTDYSIVRAEPGKYFLSEAKAAKENGIRLYAMSNTAGRTWDFGTIPYMPFPVQWLKRFNEINKAKNNYGLCGLMEGHHYGAFPSFISRLAQLTFMFEDKPEENLRRVYNAYFENSSDELIDAFEDISKAITFLPPSVEEQYGPCRNGTAYPLCLATSKKPPRLENVVSGDAFWPGFYGQFEENLGVFDLGIPYGLRHKQEVKMLKEMRRLLGLGIKKLKAIQGKNKELLTVINMCEYILCCVSTVINVKAFYEQRVALKLCDSPKKMLDICAKIRKIAETEIANAEKSLKFVRRDSSLGFEASQGYVGGEERILWKIKQVNYMLKTELGFYEREAKAHL
ncbi:MAG: hypothetical protein IKJ14_04985 [Clostridia bacterium]|nr:hypothetical protein [Clostridia bacterium]